MSAYFVSLLWLMLLAVIGWLYSLKKNNVNLVDTLWSLMFLLVALYCANEFATLDQNRSRLVLLLLFLWAMRLSGYLLIRNWGEPEDRRYQAIRANNQPNFAFKSLYIVFVLQALLAWIIAAPLVVAVGVEAADLGWLDAVATGLWLFGWSTESLADWQMHRFRQRSAGKGSVLDTGLWRYTRHPNYFGEFCIWWAFYLLALPNGGWWTLYSPLLMSFLLLKVSGVYLTEKGIDGRRPEYARYRARTPAFFPGRPKAEAAG